MFRLILGREKWVKKKSVRIRAYLVSSFSIFIINEIESDKENEFSCVLGNIFNEFFFKILVKIKNDKKKSFAAFSLKHENAVHVAPRQI